MLERTTGSAAARIVSAGIVPVAVIDDAAKSVETAMALLSGGVDVMEITLRTEAGLESIRAVSAGCPEMLVGAGTVLTAAQCEKCAESGARFIVSPGVNLEMVKWCADNGILITPGCVTPTEIMSVMEYGIDIVKFFPANVYGGLGAMKALAGPFGGIGFIPTGGINAENMGEYISAPFVRAVGGSWLCERADIAAGRFDKITKLSAAAAAIALASGKKAVIP